MAEFKPLPIGIEDFKELIDKRYCFIDKTLLIKNLLDHRSKVSLLARPRRFGKTLNLSMIQRYFEKAEKSNAYLFDGLKISQTEAFYQANQGQFPVISLSLKCMKQASFSEANTLYTSVLTY